MKNQPTTYCVLLAGGMGRRLWPVSRRSLPKQFIDFFGTGSTQIQSTYARFRAILPADRILVCTTDAYAPLVREQLPELPEENILSEPVHRNTAPSVAKATSFILSRHEDVVVVVSPTDQLVINEQHFAECVRRASDYAAAHSELVCLGVTPTRAEPGYGYIQTGAATDSPDVWHVQSFAEKPDREFARMFMESGDFLWNTGLFIAPATYLRSRFMQIFPELVRKIDESVANITEHDIYNYLHSHFETLPNVSMDKGMLELNERACVMRCDFGWADLGTWHALYESQQRGARDNVVIDSEVMLDGCQNCVIRLPKGRLGVINGLDGYIVAEEGNVLLICKKGDSSSLVKKYFSEVGMRYGYEYN